MHAGTCISQDMCAGQRTIGGGSLVSIHDVGPRNQTQTIRLAVKYLLFSEQSQWSLVILNRKSVSFRGSVLPLSPHNP